jgi:predicted phosphodiesterase
LKIGIISDLHLDHAPWPEFNPSDYSVDQWINAGDTATNKLLFNYFTEKVLPNQFVIMGNHDFWKRDILPPENYCRSAEINGLKIAGAPLWTEFSKPLDWIMYREGLVDCSYMKFWDWNESIYRHHHLVQKNFLLESKADIIVSHHAPSYQSVNDKFRGNPYNFCFATELSKQILSLEKKPKLWIHGHMHDACDYMIGETRVICNPRGYPGESNFRNYKPLIVEI